MPALFPENFNKNVDVYCASIALKSDTPVVVTLRSHMMHLMIQYLVLRGIGHNEARAKMKVKRNRYGIVDGVY